MLYSKDITKINAIRPRITISSHDCRTLLVILLWCNAPLYAAAVTVLRFIPVISYVADYIFPTITILLILFGIRSIISNMRASDVLFYLLVVIWVLVTLGVSSKYTQMFEYYWFDFLIIVVPAFFVGLFTELDYKLFGKFRTLTCLYVCSIVCVLFGVAYYAFYKDATYASWSRVSITFSYAICPSVMLLIYYCVKKRLNIYSFIIALAGVVLVVAMGTRGAILCILFMVAILVVKKTNTDNHFSKIMRVIAFAVAGVLILSKSAMLSLANVLDNLISSIGLSTRIASIMIKGNFFSDDSGRSNIYNSIISGIKSGPLFGYGFCGDRYLCGTWSHNLALELLVEFGAIFGTVLIAVIFIIIAKALWKTRHVDDVFFFIVVLLGKGLIQLMVSSTYLAEPFLFFLLGYCVRCIRKHVIESYQKG